MVHANIELRFNRNIFFKAVITRILYEMVFYVCFSNKWRDILPDSDHIIFLLFLRVSQYKYFVILMRHSGKIAMYQVDTW